MKQGPKSILRKVAISGLCFLASFGVVGRAEASVVPSDFFATDTQKILKLADYDTVQPTPNWDDLYGIIKWDNATKDNLPLGYRVWALDADKKPSGIFNMASTPGIGKYGFMHVYEDDNTTPSIDEGAKMGDILSLLVQDTFTNNMYEARFVNAPIDFHGDKGIYNQEILVNPTPIPEPTTGLLMIILSTLLLDKRKKCI